MRIISYYNQISSFNVNLKTLKRTTIYIIQRRTKYKIFNLNELNKQLKTHKVIII